jgi:hypothetical protein
MESRKISYEWHLQSQYPDRLRISVYIDMPLRGTDIETLIEVLQQLKPALEKMK